MGSEGVSKIRVPCLDGCEERFDKDRMNLPRGVELSACCFLDSAVADKNWPPRCFPPRIPILMLPCVAGSVGAHRPSTCCRECTGYLINQFLVTRTNKRTDEWGGPYESRMRFPVEIVRRMRYVHAQRRRNTGVPCLQYSLSDRLSQMQHPPPCGSESE